MNIQKEILANITIFTQKRLKDNAYGFTKYMGDGYWKVKIKQGLNLEEEIDTVIHEFLELLYDLYRPNARTPNSIKEDHETCNKIAHRASTIFKRRLDKGEIKSRYKEEK